MAESKNDPGLLGRLKTKLDRMLGRKPCEALDISYNPKQDTPSARQSFRIKVDNMHIICRSPRVKCRVCDISATGVGFLSSAEFPVGETIETALFWSGKPVIKGLKLKVMRQAKKHIGCEFAPLERGQEKLISKIVLAAQKRQIERKHKCSEPDSADKDICDEARRNAKRGSAKHDGRKIKL
ncbi:PilZ domain-containing protein [Maridesulfovibrio sp.]|uniref:PilZ domain-containing protein n=1 Tax=Maridesulfovibrio sp. TaxID=2795000 RepID=UPI002A18D06A|nr:PilZ domain-containing protein [Maridesulfovibrio sp.]